MSDLANIPTSVLVNEIVRRPKKGCTVRFIQPDQDFTASLEIKGETGLLITGKGPTTVLIVEHFDISGK